MGSLSNELTDLTFRIIEIAGDQGTGGTGLDARWLSPRIEPIDTERALLHCPGLPFLIALSLVWSELLAVVALGILGDETNLVGTSHDASPAANALILVNQHQIVFFPLVAGPGWAHRNTGRFAAVITTDRQKNFPRQGIFPLLFFQHPHPEDARRSPILGLTGQGTTLAADATF